jgi:hypothetical protein
MRNSVIDISDKREEKRELSGVSTPLALFSNDKSFRDNIAILEDRIMGIDGAEKGNNSFCPLTHRFSEGLYIREMIMPAGTVITGRIHKSDHPNFLISGTIDVVSEHGGLKSMTGPTLFLSPEGTKRAGFARTDVLWATIHANPDNITDIDELEKMIAVDTYDEYDAHLLENNKRVSVFAKLINYFRGV